MTTCWQVPIGCFVTSTVLPASKSVHNEMSGMHSSKSKALCKVAVHQQAALCAVQLCCCRGLFGAWNRMVSREHSGGWALQCTAVLVALLCTPTHSHPCSASDSLSISCSISCTLLPILVSFVMPPSFYFLLIGFVLFMPSFQTQLSWLQFTVSYSLHYIILYAHLEKDLHR